MPGQVIQIEHALAAHKLTIMRDHTCEPDRFRRLLKQVSLILCTEMTRDLDTEPKTVITPNGWTAVGQVRPQTGLVIMPVLRAGLIMAEAFAELLPVARTGHIGIYKDAENKHHCYMLSIPRSREKTKFLVLDPVISNGGTATLAVDHLLAAGIPSENIRYGSIIVSEPGAKYFFSDEKRLGVDIYCFAIDPELSADGYVKPGIGNVSSRLFRTEEAIINEVNE